MSENIKRKSSKGFAVAFILAGDLLTIWITVALLSVYFDDMPFDLRGRTQLLLATIAYIPIWLYMKPAKKLRYAITLDKVFIDAFKSVLIHALCFMSLAAFLHTDYTISFYLIFYGILFVAFPIINLLCQMYLRSKRKKGYYRTRVAIVGTNSTSERLAEAMRTDDRYGYDIVGFFDDEKLPEFTDNYIGTLDDLEKYASQKKIDQIYFTLVGEKAERMPRVVNIANDNLLTFFYVPKISKYVKGAFQAHNIGVMPVLTLGRNPLSYTVRRMSKRAFDIAFSGLFLLVSPIVFVPIAIGIKFSSPGPVFFKQIRTGYRGRSFYCYKFRTMKVNNDSDTAQATADDPRKTHIGSFLRRTNLDELPQFINVFKGDMSIVGPRPHMLHHTEYYSALIDKYMVRHIVRPGITGWAQVNGYRGITDELWKMEKRVECDVWYIENWTFSLDLKIVVRTIINTIRGDRNAF